MSRERDAIELIWKVLEDQKKQFFSFEWPGTGEAKIEQILTQMEDLVQEDLEQMARSSTRSRETPKTCPLLEEYKKSQDATNTKKFWDEEPRDSGIYSPI